MFHWASRKIGYLLEDTNIAGEHLIILIAIALHFCSELAKLNAKGYIWNMGRVKGYGRCEARHGSFYIDTMVKQV